MPLFLYPKVTHTRQIKVRQFKRYQTYKRFLQVEFNRVCVYCRQPDSSAPNLNFGVDHYRPKGIPRFAALVNVYSNLFYCCGNCNSRKNAYWPVNEAAGPYIVNPCDHQMSSHLRFNSLTGRVEGKGKHGLYTAELLQLNDDTVVKWRLNTLKIVSVLSNVIQKLEAQKIKLAKSLKSGLIDRVEFDTQIKNIDQEILEVTDSLLPLTGNLPLPPLRKQRGNVVIIPP